MTVSFAEIHRLVTEDGTVMQKMTVGCALVAQDVLRESATVERYTARIAWARRTIADPKQMGRMMVWAVMTDDDIQAAGSDATDAQIKAAIAAHVNDFVIA